jgi:hypothetical protein
MTMRIGWNRKLGEKVGKAEDGGGTQLEEPPDSAGSRHCQKRKSDENYLPGQGLAQTLDSTVGPVQAR